MKKHLVGGYRNVTVCRKFLDHMKEEIKALRKRRLKSKEI